MNITKFVFNPTTELKNKKENLGKFTLIELLVTITVLGILLGVGVPALSDLVANNRMISATNDLVASLQQRQDGEEDDRLAARHRHHVLRAVVQAARLRDMFGDGGTQLGDPGRR